MSDPMQLARAGLCAALLLAAAAVLLVGAFGALRLADAHGRAQAVRLVTGYGAPLFLAGLAVEAFSPQAAGLLALAAVFAAASGPLLAHLLANAAYDGARIDGGER